MYDLYPKNVCQETIAMTYVTCWSPNLVENWWIA